MMKNIKLIPAALFALIAAMTGCTKEENPLDNEQFIKQVFIVGANKSNNEGLSTIKLPYGKTADEEQTAYISVGTGGSKSIDRNISVTIAEAGSEAVTRFNYLYRFGTDIRYQMLAGGLYSIPQKNVQINAGETYGTIPVFVKTAGLHCDSLYALTVKIAGVSDPDYISVRKADTVLMLSFALTNAYSGNYQGQGKSYKFNAGTTDTTSLALLRTMKATDYRTVRFYHLTTQESVVNAVESGVKVRVEDNNSLTVTAWGTLAVTAGGGTYNPVTRVFDLWYNYTVAGVTQQFKGKFTRGEG